ncbi:unnamed protein product, partial [Meganyctiphanes norvegica]
GCCHLMATSRSVSNISISIKATSPRCSTFFKKNLLPILTVLSIFLGVALGLTLRHTSHERWNEREVMYVGYFGELYLRALKGMIIPLIVSSITASIGKLDLGLSKKIGLRAVSYYIATTVIAVIMGIVLVTSIHPGTGSEKGSLKMGGKSEVYTPDILMDLPRNIFPSNIIQAAFETYKTSMIPPDMEVNSTHIAYLIKKYNLTEEDLPPVYEWSIKGGYVRSTNIMGLLVFAAALGVALSKLGEKGKPLLDVFQAFSDASMVITGWIIWLSPIGILSLIASMMVKISDFSVMLGQVGMFVITVLLGITIHGLIVLPGIYMLLTRKLPFRFVANMGQAFMTAFATASAAATLPVTMNCLEGLNKVDPRITRFVLPIGTTINMDGTALYEAVAVIFLAQVRGLALSMGQIITVSITSTMASIGAAAIPGAGVVAMVMVLDVVGLPAEDLSLIIAVDWFVDRCRTTLNILSDSLGSGVVFELSKADLKAVNDMNENTDDQIVLKEYIAVEDLNNIHNVNEATESRAV